MRDLRNGDSRFPRIDVRTSDNRILRAGTENFSTANQLDQDVIELTNDLTLVKGKHTFTFGTHNEFFQFYNLFIRDMFGNYEFANLDLFEQGLAQSYALSFSATSNPLQGAEFGVNQLGFYAGDQWKVSSNFSLTYGIRADIPLFPDTPSANPVVESIYGYRTESEPEQQPELVAARGLQLESWRRRTPAGARRPRHLRRTHAVRLAVEPVREHGQRVHPHHGDEQRGQPHRLLAGS